MTDTAYLDDLTAQRAAPAASSRRRAAGGGVLRWAAIAALGGYTWAGQIKQVSPFNALPIDFTLAISALCLVLTAAVVVRHRTLGLTATSIRVWIMLLVIALSGSFFRVTSEYGIDKELLLYQLTLPIALAAAVVVSRREDFIALIAASSLWAVFLSLSVLVGGVQDQTGRLNAATGATISFSRAAGMVITAALAWALTERGRRLVWLMPIAAALLVLEVYVVIAIGSRGPAQAIIIAALMMLLLQLVRIRIRVGIRMMTVIGLGVAGLVVLWSRTPEFSRNRILGIFTGEANARSGGGRDLFYEWTIEHLPYTPFGYGWGSWPDRSGFIGYFYVHNIFLELWFEAGLVALLAFLLVLYWVTRDQIRRVRSDRFLATLAIGMIYSWLGAALVSGDFNDNRSLSMLIMAIAAVPIEAERTSTERTAGGAGGAGTDGDGGNGGAGDGGGLGDNGGNGLGAGGGGDDEDGAGGSPPLRRPISDSDDWSELWERADAIA